MFSRRACTLAMSACLVVSCEPLSVLAQSRPAGSAPASRPAVKHEGAFKREAPDPRAWTLSLNGTWEFAPEDSADFQSVKVPGFWGASPQAQKVGFKAAAQWKSGTYRRDIEIPAGMTGAILDFDMLRWGGEVLVNGRSAGTYDLGHSPAVFNVSELVQPGRNQLEVKARGWASLDRYEGKDIQIPIGAGNWFGIKDGGIPDDVRLHLYKGAWIDRLAIHPNLAGMSCDVSTRVGAGPAGFQGRIAAQMLTEDGQEAVSAVRRQALQVKPGEMLDVQVKALLASTARGWQPQSPTLYRLVVWLEAGEGDGTSIVAVRTDTFGFRQIKLVDGRLLVNSEPVRLFGGTELVMYSMLRLLEDETQFTKVQVDLFKAMNGTAFRSHMNPLPRRWLDLCDRYGIVVIPEFPNFPDVQRTSGESPYELPDYWKNLQREARGIVVGRFNHPSIVGWSVSNEGSGFGDWERRHLVPYIKALDPGRMVMLSGDTCPDMADQHNFAGMWWGTQGEFERSVADMARLYPDRMLGCSEFGQYSPAKRWYGARAVPGAQVPEFQEDFARILMEQTEVLRRYRYDLIMPYSYGGGWFGKKAGETGRPEDATAPYHALRNALAPLGVSFESRRHATAGGTMEIPVWLYSDAVSAFGETEAALYLLDRSPGYGWTGSLDGLEVLAEGRFTASVEPLKVLHQKISLNLPAEPGAYYLVAVARDVKTGQCQAISLKPLRLYAPLPKPASRLAVGVIEKDSRLASWLRSRGHRVVLAYGDRKPDVIVVAEGCLYDERIRTWGASLTSRLQSGTRLVVLEQGNWDAKVMQSDISKALTGVATAVQQTSLENLFPQASLADSVGSDADFQRLNGLDNVAMRVALVPLEEPQAAASQAGPARLTPEADKGQVAAAASQPSVWTGLIDGYGLRGDKPGWALASRAFGQGRVLACQVPLEGRIDAADAAQFDPLAERLLAFLIEGRIPEAATPPASQP